MNKITIRPRINSEDKISTGSNMEVLLDGKRLGGAYFVKFEVHAKKIAKVTIEMYAQVEVEGNFALEKRTKESKKLVNSKGKAIEIHELSNYAPKGVAFKKE